MVTANQNYLDSLSVEQALSAIDTLGVDEWVALNAYRNADPGKRGTYDAFRNQYFQQQAAMQQSQGRIQAGISPGPSVQQGISRPPGPSDETVYDEQGRFLGYRGQIEQERQMQERAAQLTPWPSQGLSEVAAGRVPGSANLLPSFGAPAFLSPQSLSRLTPSEFDIYQTEVQRKGFPLEDWQSQLQQQWGGFATPGQFGRTAKATTAPGLIR